MAVMLMLLRLNHPNCQQQHFMVSYPFIFSVDTLLYKYKLSYILWYADLLQQDPRNRACLVILIPECNISGLLFFFMMHFSTSAFFLSLPSVFVLNFACLRLYDANLVPCKPMCACSQRDS